MYLKSILVMALALFLVSSVGVAYAMWSETLKINVTVNTGEVDVEWSEWWSDDEGIDPGYDKDVAQTFVEPEQWDEEGDVIKLNVTIVNAYPSYTVTITGLVDNIGSIPVKLYGYNVTGLEGLPLEVILLIPEDTQIDPGGYGTYQLIIHVLQDADENATYTFEIELGFAQWNEVE